MKSAIRKKALSLRASLDKDYMIVAADAITEVFLANYIDFDRYLLYSSIKNEVNVANLYKRLLALGKYIYYPCVQGDKMLLGCGELKSGYQGIMEPTEFYNGSIDVAIIPGVAFDVNGYRLGYGKGFYDRFLADNPQVLKVGVSYDILIEDDVFPESHDVRMDVVLTEKRIINLF
ncbi:MAG: 5-formyltetrahydrofolate cyclo-ligase [Deferribacteraceae bacterium]|jgi:5-formyltetrahydrofolate cyclo-ligase|nr:5-formyltetrahydrofolate cyclo-ligase [Deferribacteraceae bacterium]